MSEAIKIDVDARGIVQLRLNRPEKRNALSAQMIAELTEFAASAQSRRDWRAVILSGDGATFCAGGDLDWMRQQMQADRQTRMAEARIKRRFIVWYREIKSLEDEIWKSPNPDSKQIAQWRDEIEDVDANASQIRIPYRYFQDVYALKQAIGVVRDRIAQVASRVKE